MHSESNPFYMQIVSYNINGIRAAVKKGLWDWLADTQYDILCVQETKAQDGQIPVQDLASIGYHHFWHYADIRKGYSGVGTLSRLEPTLVKAGCEIPAYDCEGRVLRTDFGPLTILNCYFPSGTTGELRQSFKMDFLEDMFDYVSTLIQERTRLIVLGDYNIAHCEIDIHDPVRNRNTSGFLPEERAWLDQWKALGFIDAYRHLYPDEQTFSWWSYRANSRMRNKGWRIDYQWISPGVLPYLQDAGQLTDIVHSDHCPVWAQYHPALCES